VNANGESLPSNQAVTSIPLPALAGAYIPGNNSVQITWPVTASSFGLYSTPSLAPPVAWTAVTNAVTNAGGLSTVTVSASGSNYALFFRLAAP